MVVRLEDPPNIPNHRPTVPGTHLSAWLRSSKPAERIAQLEAELARQTAVDAARIRFFGNVAHELRTPLAVVLGQIESALTTADDETRGRQLRMAARNARRLERLADQALELTRLDAGALTADRREMEVVEFLEALVLSFGELAERKGLLLEYVAKPRSITCALDPDQLTTIVTNLLSNALKYTPAGGRIGVAVEVRPAMQSDSDGDRLLITVADSGPGITPERQEAIFERFVRGEEADRLHPAGAGIGLALARELARIHDGTIRLVSEPGRGARFIVDLPLGHADPSTTSTAPVASRERPRITEEILHRTTGVEEASNTERESERATILIVDDHADLRDWLASELAEAGRVITAADGADALEIARATLPDLIVSDIRMAGLDGFELCRRIRGDERTSHVPVILLSAGSSVDRRVEGSEAGADAFLHKPVDGRELRAKVAALLANRRALRERFREQVIVRPTDVSDRSVDQLFFEKVMATIEEHLDGADFSVGELASEMAMSVSQLSRKLSALIGQTPGQLMRGVRLERAAALVAANTGNLTEIAYRVGFSDQAHFSRSFKRHFGMTPSEYRESRALPSALTPRAASTLRA